MKWHPLCLPCTVRTAYDIATKATDDGEQHRRVVTETIKWLSGILNQTDLTPAYLHTYVFRLVQKITGNRDPFAKLKEESNRIALGLIPSLESEISKRDFKDAFKLAVLGAICGNSIDFEVEEHSVSLKDLEKSLMSCLGGDLAINDAYRLMDALARAKKVLYLADNAGEIVFDKLLIKFITKNYPVKVVVAVKSAPILNDATMKDALQIGLNEVAEVVATGSSSIGLNLEECSSSFLTILKNSDLIIAKGQGHYESLPEIAHLIQKPIVYMFKAKCPVIAKSLGVARGSNIVKFAEEHTI